MTTITTRRRIDPEDELCIDYYPHGRPAPPTREAVLTSLRGQLASAEAHVAAGRAWVGGASQSYAVASLLRQIATQEANLAQRADDDDFDTLTGHGRF